MRYYPNTKIRFDTPVYGVTIVDGAEVWALVDPDTIIFVWTVTRMGQEHTETVTKDDTGLYHSFATPTEGGALFGEFRCTNPDVVIPVERYIEPSHFAATYDPYHA